MSALGRLAAYPIRFYRRWVSPLTPPMCRFRPTCSTYAIGALERHGLVRGAGLTVWRVLRCQPFCEGGHDPVPPPRGSAAMGVENACAGGSQVDTDALRRPPPSPKETADDSN